MTPATYRQSLRWDTEARAWVPNSPVWTDRARNPDGSPRPCPECGTTLPCTHPQVDKV